MDAVIIMSSKNTHKITAGKTIHFRQESKTEALEFGVIKVGNQAQRNSIQFGDCKVHSDN